MAKGCNPQQFKKKCKLQKGTKNASRNNLKIKKAATILFQKFHVAAILDKKCKRFYLKKSQAANSLAT